MNTKPRYSSMAIANWFIENLSRVDPLKLQKLIYFAHGWHLALRDQPLIDELIEAWDYGPVVPSVYHEFKAFGNQRIPALGTSIVRKPDGKLLLLTPRILGDDEDAGRFLQKIRDTYSKYTGIQLSTETHKPGSPWAVTRARYPNRKGADIPDEDIQEYFKQLIAQQSNG